MNAEPYRNDTVKYIQICSYQGPTTQTGPPDIIMIQQTQISCIPVQKHTTPPDPTSYTLQEMTGDKKTYTGMYVHSSKSIKPVQIWYKNALIHVNLSPKTAKIDPSNEIRHPSLPARPYRITYTGRHRSHIKQATFKPHKRGNDTTM